ncbi:hypothetical protein PJP07_31170, partial [Mycobacterium kansasii]
LSLQLTKNRPNLTSNEGVMRVFVGTGNVEKILYHLLSPHFLKPKRSRNVTIPVGIERALTHLSNELKIDQF